MLPQRSCEFSAFRELDMVNSFEKWTTIFTPAVEGDGSTKRDGSTGKPNLTRSRENTFFNAPVTSLPSSLRCLHHPWGFLIRPSRCSATQFSRHGDRDLYGRLRFLRVLCGEISRSASIHPIARCVL